MLSPKSTLNLDLFIHNILHSGPTEKTSPDLMWLLTPPLHSSLCSNHTSLCMIFWMVLACFLLGETLFAVLPALKVLRPQLLQQAPSYHSVTQISAQIPLPQKSPNH